MVLMPLELVFSCLSILLHYNGVMNHGKHCFFNIFLLSNFSQCICN